MPLNIKTPKINIIRFVLFSLLLKSWLILWELILTLATRTKSLAPYPTMNWNQMLSLKSRETNTHPREKIEERPKFFLMLFWDNLARLLTPTLATLETINKINLGFLIISKGISFCQIDNTQIKNHESFWTRLKYQAWKGAPPSFKSNAKK